MIAFVNGIVEDYSEEAVILDVNGIGYEIKISGDTAAALPSIGERMKLYMPQARQALSRVSSDTPSLLYVRFSRTVPSNVHVS